MLMLKKMINYAIVMALLFLFAESVLAVDSPPPLGEKLDMEQAAVLAKFMFMTSKFQVDDRPIVEELATDIEMRLNENGTNPVLWFFKGRISALLLSLRHSEMKQGNTTREQRLSDPEYLNYKDKSIEAFHHALELDDRFDAPMHLNVTMLGSIDMYVFSDADMQVKANRKILERVKKHSEERPPKENFEFKIYGNIVTSYIDEKRYDEALAVLEEMKKEFPYPITLKEIEDAIKRTEDRKAKAMQEAKVEEHNKVAIDKPRQINTVDKAQSQKVTKETKMVQQRLKIISEPKPQPSDSNKALISSKLVITIVITAVVILGTFIYFRRRKQ
jgi:pentatricopeptide repeat protein